MKTQELINELLRNAYTAGYVAALNDAREEYQGLPTISAATRANQWLDKNFSPAKLGTDENVGPSE